MIMGERVLTSEPVPSAVLKKLQGLVCGGKITSTKAMVMAEIR